MIAVAGFVLAVAGVGVSPSFAAKGDCSQPVTNGANPTASDCGYVLRAAVGSEACELCVCDANGSAQNSTADALVCLRKAVGQQVALSCPPCETVTTTTIDNSGPSTTSTSTTSTTTTIPVRCSGDAQCSALPPTFRCNPNTETCEEPCVRNTQCKDFYLCNKTTGYCEEPAPQF